MISNTQLEIASLVNQQIHETLKEYLKSVDLKTLVNQAMNAAVDDAVSRITNLATERLLKERNIANEIGNLVTNSLNESIEQHSKAAVKSALAQCDLKAIIAHNVDKTLQVQISNFNFPNNSIPAKSIKWAEVKLSGDHVEGGLIKNFNSLGIQDLAKNCQLTVMDDAVVVEGNLITSSVKTKDINSENIEVKNIKITGKVDDSGTHLTELITGVSQTVVDKNFKNKDFDIGTKSIRSENKLLLDSNSLGPSITASNLRKLGLLQELRVQGDSKFSETMIVTENGRVGINTEEPAGAFTIWDQDAEVTIKKLSKRHMLIGSTRGCDLTFGDEEVKQIVIKQNEVSIGTSLKIQSLKISVAASVPDYHGEPNEICFVPTASHGQPLAYICQGQNTWASLGITKP